MFVLFLFLLIFTLLDLLTIFITAHGKASFASGVYAMGGISVCLSVCLSHSGIMSKWGDAEGCSLPTGSPVPPVFWRQEWLMGDDPVQIKVGCKEVDPCENSRAVHLWPHNSGTVIDSENTSSSVNANRKSNMGFPTSHQRRSCGDHSWIPQNGVQMPKFVFFPKKFRQKTYKYATKFHFVYKLPAVKL